MLFYDDPRVLYLLISPEHPGPELMTGIEGT